VKTLREKFSQLVERLSNNTVSIAYEEGMRIVHFQNPYHWDVIGTAHLSIPQRKGAPATLDLMHNEHHAYVKVTTVSGIRRWEHKATATR